MANTFLNSLVNVINCWFEEKSYWSKMKMLAYILKKYQKVGGQVSGWIRKLTREFCGIVDEIASLSLGCLGHGF